MYIMRRSNCSALIPPTGQPRGQRKMCVIRKGGALEKRVNFVKKVMSPGVPGGGMGPDQFDRRIMSTEK